MTSQHMQQRPKSLTRRVALTTVAVAASAPHRAFGQTAVRLRLGSYLAPVSHSVTRILKPWIENIAKDSDGRIGFELFTGGALGRSPYAAFDLLRAGVSEVAFAQPNYTSGQFPQLQIMELPFLTHTSTESAVMGWRLCESGLVSGFEDVKLLGIWSAEPGMLFTRVPIAGLNDVNGLKIRSAGRLEGEFIESLGATAEAMFPADVYEALRRHTIHGTVVGWVALQTFQIYRVVTHVHTAPFGVVSFALMMNRETWESLPKDLQDIMIRNSGMRLAQIGGNAYDQRIREFEGRHRAEGKIKFVEASPGDMEQLRASVKPLIDAWIARTPRGRETYEAALDTLNQLRTRERAS